MEYELLGRINSPEDLKKLDGSALPRLCEEIRDCIIKTVSKNGGHLSSNLGAVELTVALHRVFSCPEDSIVFDVGHQSYTHKLLTGRYEQFSTLRREGGISGFTRPDESPCDAVVSGHSSTSVSSAFGILKGKLLRGEPGKTVAVVGDGALTGGMVYEALNNAGRDRSNLIIVLNDNTMSISRNVGALARHLNVIRSKPGYFKMKHAFKRLLWKIPFIGARLESRLGRSVRAVKNALYNSNIFEGFGLHYMGPADGHDIPLLETLLREAAADPRPVLLHVVTTKGKGYPYAEEAPALFHGVEPFDPAEGLVEHGKSFSTVFGETLCELAESDDRICAITAAMPAGTGLEKFSERFRPRFFDVGIAEEHAVTFAAGLATAGLRPFVAVYSSFLQRAYDQLLHDAAIARLPVTACVDRAGFSGSDGETHQGLYDPAFLSSIPGIEVYSPASYGELSELLRRAAARERGLWAIRYPRGGEPERVLPYGGGDFAYIPGKRSGAGSGTANDAPGMAGGADLGTTNGKNPGAAGFFYPDETSGVPDTAGNIPGVMSGDHSTVGDNPGGASGTDLRATGVLYPGGANNPYPGGAGSVHGGVSGNPGAMNVTYPGEMNGDPGMANGNLSTASDPYLGAGGGNPGAAGVLYLSGANGAPVGTSGNPSTVSGAPGMMSGPYSGGADGDPGGVISNPVTPDAAPSVTTATPSPGSRYPGEDVVLVTYGTLCGEVLAALDDFPGTGLIKLTRIHPLPPEAVEIASSCRAVLFYEEAGRSGGIGERFATALCERGFAGVFRHFAVDGFAAQGTVAEQRRRYGLDSAGMREQLRLASGAVSLDAARPGAAYSDAGDPGMERPGTACSDAMDSDAAHSGKASPGTASSTPTYHGAASRNTGDSDAACSGTAKPGAPYPNTASPNTGDSDAACSGATHPGEANPGVVCHGAGDPGAVYHSTRDPGATCPGTAKPGAPYPNTASPNTGDSNAMCSGATCPGETSPGATCPDAACSNAANPGTACSGTGNPGTGNPGAAGDPR